MQIDVGAARRSILDYELDLSGVPGHLCGIRLIAWVGTKDSSNDFVLGEVSLASARSKLVPVYP